MPYSWPWSRDADAGEWRRVRVLAREELENGQELVGPVVVEDASSTLVIPTGAKARRDASGNLIVDADRSALIAAPAGGEP
jgi:N-methylhydantoinase A